MAVDYPLVLYECRFDGLSWMSESEEESHVLGSLLQHWTRTAVKAQVLHGMIRGLQSTDAGNGNTTMIQRCINTVSANE